MAVQVSGGGGGSSAWARGARGLAAGTHRSLAIPPVDWAPHSLLLASRIGHRAHVGGLPRLPRRLTFLPPHTLPVPTAEVLAAQLRDAAALQAALHTFAARQPQANLLLGVQLPGTPEPCWQCHGAEAVQPPVQWVLKVRRECTPHTHHILLRPAVPSHCCLNRAQPAHCPQHSHCPHVSPTSATHTEHGE